MQSGLYYRAGTLEISVTPAHSVFEHTKETSESQFKKMESKSFPDNVYFDQEIRLTITNTTMYSCSISRAVPIDTKVRGGGAFALPALRYHSDVPKKITL